MSKGNPRNEGEVMDIDTKQLRELAEKATPDVILSLLDYIDALEQKCAGLDDILKAERNAEGYLVASAPERRSKMAKTNSEIINKIREEISKITRYDIGMHYDGDNDPYPGIFTSKDGAEYKPYLVEYSDVCSLLDRIQKETD